jgi:hypothetical protein
MLNLMVRIVTVRLEKVKESYEPVRSAKWKKRFWKLGHIMSEDVKIDCREYRGYSGLFP